MNLSVIGGGGGGPGGGGGGPVGAVTTGVVGFVDAEGGGAFGLKRKRFRSASTGDGRSLPSASRFTSGAAGRSGFSAWPPCRPAVRLDDVGPAGDVGEPITPRYTTSARTTSKAPSRICLRRS